MAAREAEVPGGRSLDWAEGAVVMVDQTRLPGEYVLLRVDNAPDMAAAIRRLSVRGAPAIGVAGAFGVALAVREHGGEGAEFGAAVEMLRAARPTAVNLARMVERTAAVAAEGFERTLREALRIRDEEVAASVSIGEYGADLAAELAEGAEVRAMTICNTGGLATVERGTALAVIAALFERGLLGEALVMETRPLLQGARLTAWELARMGAPHRLLVDSAGPFLLARGGADLAVTGADRIAANGDTANKIGTFALALGARYAQVPLVVAAPESTIDMNTPAGEDIPIEDRGAAEVTAVRGAAIAPPGTPAANPAFDVTPASLITAIVTDRRVIRLDRGETLSQTPLGPLRPAP